MIGIVSPYEFCDTTAAALNVANLAKNLGNDVRILSRNSPVHVDREWNAKASKLSFYRSPICDVYIHFDFGNKLREHLDIPARDARHILVPTLKSLCNVDSSRFVPDHSLIVCPNYVVRQNLIHECFQGIDDDRLITLPFPATKMSPARVIGDRLGLTLVTGRSTDLEILDFLLTSLCGLNSENLHIQVIGLRAWNDRERRILRQHGALLHQPRTFVELDRIFLQTDLTISTLEDTDFGSLLSRSISCGAPVIAFDTLPFSTVITDNVNGFLIEKPLDSFELAAGRMLDKLYACIRDPNILVQVRTSMRSVKTSAEFDRTWRTILDLSQ